VLFLGHELITAGIEIMSTLRSSPVIGVKCVTYELVCPLYEVLHIGRVGAAASALARGELAAEQALVDPRHLRRAVISLDLEARGA
jgi:hypothetical protein